MPSRERQTFAFALGVITLAFVASCAAWFGALQSSRAICAPGLVFWLGMACVAELFWLDNARGEGMVSMSSAVNIATIALLPWEVLVAVTALSVFGADRGLRGRSLLRSAFNAGQSVLAVSAGWFAFRALTPQSVADLAPTSLDPIPLTVAIGLFWLVNTGLVSGVVALEHGRGFTATWREHYANVEYGKTFAALTAIGLLLVGATNSFGLIAAPLSIALFLVTREAHRGWVERAARNRASDSSLAPGRDRMAS